MLSKKGKRNSKYNTGQTKYILSIIKKFHRANSVSDGNPLNESKQMKGKTEFKRNTAVDL